MTLEMNFVRTVPSANFI